VQAQEWRSHVPAGQTADVVGGGTLPAVWSRLWERDGGSQTLCFPGRSGGDHRWVGTGELDQRSREVAARLAALGLPRTSRVAWVAERSVESVVACIGVLRAGLVLVPVDTQATERELAHVASEIRPDVVIADDPGRSGVLSGLGAVVLDTNLSGLQQETGANEIDEADANDPALIGFTSGTTGAPKGAVLTHANLLANAESLRIAWRWGTGDRLIHALPLFHGHGLCAALFGTLNAGASVVVLPGFDPRAVTDAISEYEASLFFGVPTMYHRIAAADGCSQGLSSLRLAVSGSAPLKVELHAEIERTSGVSILERYGMTETLLTVSNPVDAKRRAGTIGFPLPGTDAVLGEETGGELWVRGHTVFSGYFEKPAQTAERFTADGWFRTGDLGTVEDGYVRLLGRSTEVVISGGHNVYPAEVEDVLLGFPEVVEVAVSGTPSEEWGEVVTAWVVSSSSKLDIDGLLAHASAALAPYKRPRIVRQVGSLPRNSMGKVQRRLLE
jgi:malonyl-CoA/methylmalonyl-CoA synthetase